VLSFSYS